jgi:hypothetical protein
MQSRQLVSDRMNWAPNSTIKIPLTFLDACRSFAAPVVPVPVIHFNLDVTIPAESQGVPAAELYTLATRILLKDAGGDRWNTRGSSARVINQVVYGWGQSDGPDITASGNVDFRIRMPFDPKKSKRRNDSPLALFELVDGGRFELTTSGNTPYNGGVTVTGGYVELETEVVDDGVREAKSRLCYKDVDIVKANDHYPINGALAMFLPYVGEVAEVGGTPWADHTIFSDSLQYNGYLPSLFKDKYLRESFPILPQTDGTGGQDTIDNGYTDAVLVPDSDQKIPDMPRLQSMHLKLDPSTVVDANNLPQVIYAYIERRDISLVMRTFGFPNEQATQEAIDKWGYIKLESGKYERVGKPGGFDKDIARMMPLKLRIPPASAPKK